MPAILDIFFFFYAIFYTVMIMVLDFAVAGNFCACLCTFGYLMYLCSGVSVEFGLVFLLDCCFASLCRSNKLSKDNKRKGGGFTMLCSLSPQLQNFVGVSELSRTGVICS